MATAGELIKGALRLLGVLAEGEEPSADSYADALVAFNQMVESWSTERLAVYGTTEKVHTWPAGEASQTIGPTSDIEKTPCPVRIDESTYYVIDGYSYGLRQINVDQYNAIRSKDIETEMPQVMWSNMILDAVFLSPRIQMTLYPVPAQDIEMHVVFVQELTQANATSDQVYVPQGYLRAFRYNLAVELAPEFGVPAPSDVKRIASKSKSNLKRINNPDKVLSIPAGLIGTPRYNIVTDGYQ